MKKILNNKIIIIILFAIIAGLIFINFSKQNKIKSKQEVNPPQPIQNIFPSIIGIIDYSYFALFNIGSPDSSLLVNTYSGNIKKINLKSGFIRSIKFEKGIYIKSSNGKHSFLALSKNSIASLEVYDKLSNILSFDDLRIGDDIQIIESIKFTGIVMNYNHIKIIRE